MKSKNKLNLAIIITLLLIVAVVILTLTTKEIVYPILGATLGTLLLIFSSIQNWFGNGEVDENTWKEFVLMATIIVLSILIPLLSLNIPYPEIYGTIIQYLQNFSIQLLIGLAVAVGVIMIVTFWSWIRLKFLPYNEEFTLGCIEEHSFLITALKVLNKNGSLEACEKHIQEYPKQIYKRYILTLTARLEEINDGSTFVNKYLKALEVFDKISTYISLAHQAEALTSQLIKQASLYMAAKEIVYNSSNKYNKLRLIYINLGWKEEKFPQMYKLKSELKKLFHKKETESWEEDKNAAMAKSNIIWYLEQKRTNRKEDQNIDDFLKQLAIKIDINKLFSIKFYEMKQQVYFDKKRIELFLANIKNAFSKLKEDSEITDLIQIVVSIIKQVDELNNTEYQVLKQTFNILYGKKIVDSRLRKLLYNEIFEYVKERTKNQATSINNYFRSRWGIPKTDKVNFII